MTRKNVYVILLFLGSLAAVGGVLIAWDVSLKLHDLTGDTTISWSMALLGASSPGAIFFLGLVTGGVVCGLPVHFWLGMPSPQLWADYQRLQVENAEMRKLLGPLAPPA